MSTWVQLPVRAQRAPSAAERRAALERLLVWAKQNGAQWDGIELRVDENGARFVASRRLAARESILTIPRSLMIVDDELEESATGPVPFGWQPRPRDTLAAWLALEAQAATSPWRPYLETLPVQLDGFPMFRDANDLAVLAGTAAHTLASDLNRDVLDVHGRLPAELRARVSLADFAWGRAIVMSRAFHAPGSFDDRVALIPLVDLFDHDHDRDDTGWSYSPFDEKLVVRTECEIASGDDVHFSYGVRSNSHLLVHYGFTLPHNPVHEAGLWFELPPHAPAHVRIGGVIDHRFVRALALSRVLACEPDQRERVLQQMAPPADNPYLGGALEEAALAVLATVVRRARDELDRHAPGGADAAWERTCARVRDGERAILDQLLEVVTAAREHARCEDPAQLRAIADTIAPDATGARRMLRHYLQDLADLVAA